MSELPTWWIVVTGLASLMMIVTTFVFTVAMMKLMEQMKVHSARIEALSNQMSQTTKKLDALVDDARESVQIVGGNVRRMTGSLSATAESLGTRLETISRVFSVAMLVIRMLKLAKERHTPHDAELDRNGG